MRKPRNRCASPVCGKNARGKNAIGKNVRGKIARGKNVRAKMVKIPNLKMSWVKMSEVSTYSAKFSVTYKHLIKKSLCRSCYLNPYQITNFLNEPNSKDLQMSNKMLLKYDFCLRVENIVGKGENAVYHYFLLFPLCFQKAPFYKSLKVGIVW